MLDIFEIRRVKRGSRRSFSNRIETYNLMYVLKITPKITRPENHENHLCSSQTQGAKGEAVFIVFYFAYDHLGLYFEM
jgi:hypothetical protein